MAGGGLELVKYVSANAMLFSDPTALAGVGEERVGEGIGAGIGAGVGAGMG